MRLRTVYKTINLHLWSPLQNTGIQMNPKVLTKTFTAELKKTLWSPCFTQQLFQRCKGYLPYLLKMSVIIVSEGAMDEEVTLNIQDQENHEEAKKNLFLYEVTTYLFIPLTGNRGPLSF